MTKPLSDLLSELDVLEGEIRRVRLKENSGETIAARFPQASVATRQRLRPILVTPPQQRGISTSDHQEHLFEWCAI